MSGIIPIGLESATVHMVGKKKENGGGVIGCGEAGYGGW
jgi:hypothetical protein